MYQYRKEVKLGYSEAVAKAREELQKEGFGVKWLPLSKKK